MFELDVSKTKDVLELIVICSCALAFIGIVIFSIYDIVASNKYWKKMRAELDVYKRTLHKEHDLLKRVQTYMDWLHAYTACVHVNTDLEDTEFNRGTKTAAEDIQSKFIETMGEYVDE